MKIKTVEFIASAVGVNDYPKVLYPEIAFAGKSNVGKSSLINTLLNHKNLARVSSMPGKTSTINFFLINQKCHFVDLPGYGFANRSKSMLAEWKGMIEQYLSHRKQLKAVALLIDIRQGSEGDIIMREWLSASSIPVIFIVTKSDKVTYQQKNAAKKEIIERLSIDSQSEPIILFSSKNREGKDELLSIIESYLIK